MLRNDLRACCLKYYFKTDIAAQKKLKRKEYIDANSFAADVELIFNNAIEYNLDHSMLWEDAHALRVRIPCFRSSSSSLTVL